MIPAPNKLLPYMTSHDRSLAERERNAGRLTFFREVRCAAAGCNITIPKQFTYCTEECWKRSVIVALPIPEIVDIFDPDYYYYDEDDGLGEAPL